MGRGARNICTGLLAGLALVAGLSGLAGASEPKHPRPPRISRVTASVANRVVRITSSVNPERLQTSYALELVYHAPGCCPPKSKECCKETPETEVVGSGTLTGASAAHEVHASASLRSGNYSVRARVQATNRLGTSEKSRKIS
jgi:hypothetical protein